MKNAIIVHGMQSKEDYYDPQYPSQSNFHWIPWLQKQLLMHDIATATPEMPLPYAPEYAVWKKEFERYDVTPETILVGHSAGGGFLVRWLSEHAETHVGKVFLVAPWLDLQKESDTGFFDFEIDPKITLRVQQVTIFNDTDDEKDIHASVQKLRDVLNPVDYVEVSAQNHFCVSVSFKMVSRNFSKPFSNNSNLTIDRKVRGRLVQSF